MCCRSLTGGRQHPSPQETPMPEMRNIVARSLPYRETTYGTYTCQRCGIQRRAHTKNTTYCFDCRHEATRLGWIEGPKTFDCAHCGQTMQAKPTSRETCNVCTKTLSRRKAA